MSVFHLVCTRTPLPMDCAANTPGESWMRAHRWFTTCTVSLWCTWAAATAAVSPFRFIRKYSRMKSGQNFSFFLFYSTPNYGFKTLRQINKYLIFKIGWINICTESVVFFKSIKKINIYIFIGPFQKFKILCGYYSLCQIRIKATFVPQDR